jgi:hypothetical protein
VTNFGHATAAGLVSKQLLAIINSVTEDGNSGFRATAALKHF